MRSRPAQPGHTNPPMNVRLFEMVAALATTLDLLDPILSSHQKRTCLIAAQIARGMDMNAEDYKRLFIAAIFHDIGALALQDRLKMLAFEESHPHEHARMGAQLLARFEAFAPYATLVRFHHVPWDHGRGQHFDGQDVPLLSHLIHLADRIEVLVQGRDNILADVAEIEARIVAGRDSIFHPALVDAFLTQSGIECFWLDILSINLDRILADIAPCDDVELDLHQLTLFARFVALIIDSRCHFTATHSAGVAICAETLARHLGWSAFNAARIRIAGYLHDTGKLAIPNELINRNGPLLADEMARVRSHSYITHDILSKISGLEDIAQWASHHHERLDGSGYPFHKVADQLSQGARIIAVADIYTAMTEDRPYRQGLTPATAFTRLDEMVQAGKLDPRVVATLQAHHEEIDACRRETQRQESRELAAFWQQVERQASQPPEGA